jgi:potassium voltage-gated channel Shaw-related subfamily C protein 1
LFRNTEETLNVIELLDSEQPKKNEADIAVQFGWEDDFLSGHLSFWQQVKPKIWAVFEDAFSSRLSKVKEQLCLVNSKPL